jgi:BirA family transcriptional regulator, biotin operon repressor / biotin---[acetyl-CoA-carboxylase] ligase
MSALRPEIANLPAAYELVVCDAETDAAAEAGRLAALGAEEGTLVWASEAAADEDRFDRATSGTADFSCALVLRPEDPREMAMQLVQVALVSLGAYVASEVPPMTALRYEPPGEVLIGESRLANVTAAPGPSRGDRYEWLVLGVTLNVRRLPEPSALGDTYLRVVGVEDAEPAKVLVGFARYFLCWIDRWAGEGFEPVRKAWLARARQR